MPKKVKSKGVSDADTPLTPITAKERRKIRKSIKKKYDGFRFPVPSPQRKEAVGPCGRSQKEDPTGFCEGRYHRRGLAYVSTYSRDPAGGHGRTSTHDPRLLAPQQSPCGEQVSSSHSGEQTTGAREIGGCDLARWCAAGEQINTHSVVGVGERVPEFFRGSAWLAEYFDGPDGFFGSAVSTSK
jgi:hypothetical protein